MRFTCAIYICHLHVPLTYAIDMQQTVEVHKTGTCDLHMPFACAIDMQQTVMVHTTGTHHHVPVHRARHECAAVHHGTRVGGGGGVERHRTGTALYRGTLAVARKSEQEKKKSWQESWQELAKKKAPGKQSLQPRNHGLTWRALAMPGTL